MFKVDGRSGRQLTIGNRNYSMAVHIDHSKNNDAKAETPVLWPPHEKSWLIGKASDAGRDWGQEEKGTTEDEIAGWHHWLDGRESEWTPGVGDGQGGLACCNSWGPKELDKVNWIEQAFYSYVVQVVDSAEGIKLRLSCLFLLLELWRMNFKWEDWRWETCCRILTARWQSSGQGGGIKGKTAIPSRSLSSISTGEEDTLMRESRFNPNSAFLCCVN